MKQTSRTASVFAALAMAIATVVVAPVAAHHSFAMYDMTVQKTMTGKMIRFVLGGNHSQFVFQALNADGTPQVADGKPVTWSIETGAAIQLSRRNITVETLKPGEIITITFSPLRDGRNGGAQREGGLIMCGMKLPEGGCTAKTGKTY